MLFKSIKAGDIVQLKNGMTATVTEVGSKTFLAKPDGGKHRAREFNFSGETVDASYNITAILNKSKRESFKYDFGFGAVDAHYHMNPDGTWGGIVADTVSVDDATRIGTGSVVFGDAVLINCQVKGNSRIGGGEFANVVLDGQVVTARAA